jgi:hypothetical protein
MFYADERLDFASLTRLLTELENLPCDLAGRETFPFPGLFDEFRMERQTEMKRSPRPARIPKPGLPVSEGLNHEPAKLSPKFSSEHPAEMAVQMEKGLRDLPVWKDLVARVGLKEARKILHQGMLVNSLTDGHPKN